MAEQNLEVYPFSTQDGKAIPLDILKPKGLMFCIADPLIPKTLDLGAEAQVALITATGTAIASFSDSLSALVPEFMYEDGLLIPKDTFVATLLLGRYLNVRAMSESCTVYVQLIEKWAGLALPLQFTRK